MKSIYYLHTNTNLYINICYYMDKHETMVSLVMGKVIIQKSNLVEILWHLHKNLGLN